MKLTYLGLVVKSVISPDPARPADIAGQYSAISPCHRRPLEANVRLKILARNHKGHLQGARTLYVQIRWPPMDVENKCPFDATRCCTHSLRVVTNECKQACDVTSHCAANLRGLGWTNRSVNSTKCQSRYIQISTSMLCVVYSGVSGVIPMMAARSADQGCGR